LPIAQPGQPTEGVSEQRHGSVHSRGAQYRSEARALIPASLRVVDKQQGSGILRLTLEKR
jgi:hypothetical protein